MKTLRLVADFTYDDEQMHSDDPKSTAWFYNDILKGNNLILNDIGDIGDCLGGITILDITERADTKVKTAAYTDPDVGKTGGENAPEVGQSDTERSKT